jgi:transcriptional regulator with XRE-family HTH domain
MNLKKFRLLAGLTQSQIAAQLKISQSTYQRWESGTLPIPTGKKKPLARLVGVKPGDLIFEEERFDYVGIDITVPPDRRYYGEVAVHFNGGGAPLMLPISVAERDRLVDALEGRELVITFSSLDNWTVAIRLESISDLYLSSDACDEYGPEADKYHTHLGVFPDNEFWEIVEHAEVPEALAELELDDDRIRSVLAGLYFDEEVFQKAIAEGAASESDRKDIEQDIERDAPKLVERATNLAWQLSNGTMRSEYVDEDVVLADTLNAIDLLSPGDTMILSIPVERWHRTICFNLQSLDFIAFPSQRVQRGMSVLASELVD